MASILCPQCRCLRSFHELSGLQQDVLLYITQLFFGTYLRKSVADKHTETANKQLGNESCTQVVEYDDGVYYRFGGAVISDMVNLRYTNIKKCPSIKKHKISQEITILLSINTKDKSEMPDYLKYRDCGYMYSPKSSFIPFVRVVDVCVNTASNSASFLHHGDEIVKVHV